MYAQEDVEDLSFSGHGLYLPEGIMFFLRTEGAFHGGDPTLADAILDRSVSNAYKIELKGESMRQR